MKVGVPGEFHEDRWQRTAEDSERLCSRAHGKRAVPIEFKLSRGKAFFWPAFGTTTLPTGTSGASPRGEGVFWPVFGTTTMPTDVSGASRRGEGGFWPDFGTATMPTSTSGASPRGKEGLLTDLRHDNLAYRHLRAIPACQRGFKAEKSSDLRAARRNGLKAGRSSELKAGRRSDLRAGRRRGAPRRR